MDYEDRIAISTPEGIAIEYPLAGLASRYIAALIDLAIKGTIVAAVVLILSGAHASDTAQAVAVIVASFFALFVYDVVFEVWGAGRTPGKRWNGLRVVTDDGRPIELPASSVRRLLWMVDAPLTVFIAGSVSILVTERNQRLGDLAAGTVVVRERLQSISSVTVSESVTPRTPYAVTVDVTAITPTELAAVRDFLARRKSLSYTVRERSAERLAEAREPEVGGLPPGGLQAESLLETIAAAKR
jgi:uncharacterized RDD family membrane protein YckC